MQLFSALFILWPFLCEVVLSIKFIYQNHLGQRVRKNPEPHKNLLCLVFLALFVLPKSPCNIPSLRAPWKCLLRPRLFFPCWMVSISCVNPFFNRGNFIFANRKPSGKNILRAHGFFGLQTALFP